MKLSRLCPALLTAANLPASAVVVNVDFNHIPSGGPNRNIESPTHAGPGAPGTADPAGPGSYWNPAVRQGNEANRFNLLTSTGAASTIGFRISGISGSANSLVDQQGPEFGDLTRDYLFLDSGSPTAVATAAGHFLGLIPSATYELYFYGQGDDFIAPGSPGQNSLFSITNAAGINLGPAEQTSWNSASSVDGILAEGIEFVKFTAMADGDGKIYFKFSNVVSAGGGANVTTDEDGNNSRYGPLNGMQLVLVPEPSAFLLGGLGALAFVTRRRR